MIDVLRKYVKGGGVLIGVSAGAILMTPDISTSGLCGDDPAKGDKDNRGLNLVDFAFVPHYGGNFYSLKDVKKYARDKKTVVYAAKDTGAIVVEGDKIKCIGDVFKVE